MSIEQYNMFTENPLAILEDRFPILEEFLLALDHFFVKKVPSSNEGYKEVRQNIENSKKGIKNLDVKKALEYLTFFNFGDIKSSQDVLGSYWNIYKHPFLYTRKNDYICFAILNLFAQRWNIQESASHWLNTPPEDNRPFSNYLRKIHPTFEKCTNLKIIDNYRKWTEKDITPDIRTFIDFWNTISEEFKESVIPQKEILFSFWIWQKMRDELKVESFHLRSIKYPDGLEQIQKIRQILKNEKAVDHIAEINELLHHAKDSSEPLLYSVILSIELKHIVFQKKFKAAISLLQGLSKILFWEHADTNQLSHTFAETLSCVAYIYSRKDTESNDKKSLKSIFKKMWELGLINGFIQEVSLNAKDVWAMRLESWKKNFDNYYPKHLFYGNFKKPDFYGMYPAPNPKKADSFLINFGECRDTPQIVFFSRMNDVDSVHKLLNNPNTQVAKTSPLHDSALFWSLQNMSLRNPYGYAQTSLFPTTKENLKNEKALRFFATIYKNPDYLDINVYRKKLEQQINSAHQIFEMLIPHYEDIEHMRGKTFDDLENSFSLIDFGNETILNAAIETGDKDIVQKVIRLFNKYEKNIQKKLAWINMKAGFPPRPPIYMLIGLYSDRLHTNFILQNPNQSFNKPVSIDIHAECQQILYPTVATTIQNKIEEIKWLRSFIFEEKINSIFKKNRALCIEKMLSEDSCLEILKILLDNGADPLIKVNMEHSDNGPNNYDAMKFAAEIGWLNGFKIMFEHIVSKQDVTSQMLDDWAKIACGWADIWRNKLNDVIDYEQRAKDCDNVFKYILSIPIKN